MKSKKLESEFNILTNEEIQQCTDLQNALELINKENVITEIEPLEAKKFVVKQNENLTELTKSGMIEKEEAELDEIANQADQAFYDLMDIALNSVGKSVGDISSSAQNFLTIKLNARMAKFDSKMKKMSYELQKQKVEMSAKKSADIPEKYTEDDGIVIIEND
jgi:UDP-N-acetylglucosamine 2-epimerase